MRFRRTALAFVLVAACSLACVTRRAPAWIDASRPEPGARASETEAPPITLVVLGDAGAPGRVAALVADELERVLVRARRDGVKPLLLWLGNNVLGRGRDCADARVAWRRRGSVALAAVVERHRGLGGQSFAVPGPDDWRCDHRSDRAGPWRMPAEQYALRLADDGTAAVALTCDPDGCHTHPAAGRLELVMADLSPWLDHTPAGEASLRALDHLMAYARRREPDDPPRILVSHVPIEAAGTHGLAAMHPDSTFHVLPPSVRAAVRAGAFVGVIGGRDRASYAHPDLSDAIRRSDRVWIDRPLFEVVSGAASRPDARSLRLHPRFRYFTSTAFVPDIYTPGPGFAVVRLQGGAGVVTIHDRFGAAWRTARIPLDLAPAPLPVEGPAPSMAPCLRCPAVPASERP